MTVEKPIRNDKAAVVAGRPVPAGVDLAQPVALDALVHHKLLMPGKDCLSCSLMVCMYMKKYCRYFITCIPKIMVL